MARRPIGLDIGSTAVRAVELTNGGGRPTLMRMAQLPLPAGVVSNGEIRDPAQVAEALKELWRMGRFPGNQVHLGVGNQRVVVREVVLPWLEDRELRESLPYQVREFVPIPLEEAVLDHQVVEEFEQEGRRMVRVLLAAAQKVMVSRIVEAAEMAKLRAVGLDLVPFAIVRSAGSNGWNLQDDEPADEAVVDVGADVTSICVHAHGRPRFVRMLPWGGRSVTAAVARSLGVDEPEAERLKRLDPASANGDASALEQVMAVTARVAAAFADDLRSSLDFYRSQVPGAQIRRVLLTGGGSRLRGLPEVVDGRLAADVATGRPFHRVVVPEDLPPQVVADAEPLLAVAVGLAMPGGEE